MSHLNFHTKNSIRSVCNANFLNIGTFAPNSGWFWRENSNCIFQLKTKLRSSLRSQWSEWFSNNVTLDALDIKTMILLCFFFAIIQFMALQHQPKLDLDSFSARVRDFRDGKFPWRLFKIHTFDILFFSTFSKRLTIPTWYNMCQNYQDEVPDLSVLHWA